MATYAATIGGVAKAIQEGWSISESANGRGRMDFAVKSLDGTYRPAVDAEIIFTEDGTRIFGGLIDRPAESSPTGNGSTAIITTLSAVDFNVYASRIHLTADIPAGNLKAALTVVANALSAQGVTLDVSQVNGPSLPALTYSDRPIVDVLDEIVTLSSTTDSYIWEIDYNKVLRGYVAGSIAAPSNITDTDGNVAGDMAVERPRQSDYANYITLLGGTGTRGLVYEFTGDGVTRVFPLPIQAAVKPSQVYDRTAGAFRNVGTHGVDTLFEWTYRASDNSIVQLTEAPPGNPIAAHPNTDTFDVIDYIGQFPHKVFADGGLPAAQRVQKTYTQADVFDVTVMQGLADSYLVRDMSSPKTVRFKLKPSATGWHPGQVVTITSTKRNLSGAHLITDVRIAHLVGWYVQRSVTAVSSSRLPSTLRESFQQTFSSRGGTSAGTVGVVSSGGVGGAGTLGTLPKWATSTILGDSLIREGTGSPEGVVTAPIASMFLRTDTGDIYRKATGSGNTGWTGFGGAGVGTVNTLSKWVTTSTLGDAIIAEDSGNAVVGGHLLPTLTDTYDLGRYDKLWNQGYLAQLNAVLFALNTQTLFGGYSTIGYQAGSFAAAVTSGATTINFGTTMTPGHFIQVRAHDTGGTATSEFIQVGSLVSGTTYNVTRNLSGIGAKNWAQGVPFLVLGTTGTGRIDLLAFDGKPRVAFVEQGSAYNTQTVRSLLGNLNGHYGYATDLYGAAFGVPSGARVTVDPTNGVRLYDGSDTVRVHLTTAGGATFSGDGGSVTNINGGNIQTGTVTANKLLISSVGAALNSDPDTKDLSAWVTYSTFSPFILDSITDGQSGNSALTGTSGQRIMHSVPVPYDSSKTYRLRVWARRSSGADGDMYLGFMSFDSTGAGTALNVPWDVAAGVTPSTSWTEYTGLFSLANHPTGPVKYLAVSAALNFGGTTGWHQVQGFRLEEVLPSVLIQDGAITAAKITANAVTADKIQANAVTTAKLDAGAVTAAKIAAGTITANEIASATITATQIASSTITATQIASGTITADRLNVSTLSAISANLGTVTTGTINGPIATFGAVDLDSSGIEIPSGAKGSGGQIAFVGTFTSTISGTSLGAVIEIDGGLLVTGDLSTQALIQAPSIGADTGTALVRNGSNYIKTDSSSERYKSRIEPWAPENDLDILKAQTIHFDYTGGTCGVVGFSAEQLYSISPELVNLDDKGRPDSIRSNAMFAFMLSALRALQRRLDEQ